MLLARIAGTNAEALFNRALSSRPLSWRLLIGGALLLVLIVSGISVVIASAPNAVQEKSPSVVGDSVTVRTDVEVPPIHKCRECGFIESRRTVVRDGDAAAHDAVIPGAVDGLNGIQPGAVSVSQVTVRMNDGTSRQFEDASLSNWRPGERMIFIEGVSAANR